jgi:hypothetical protein
MTTDLILEADDGYCVITQDINDPNNRRGFRFQWLIDYGWNRGLNLENGTFHVGQRPLW